MHPQTDLAIASQLIVERMRHAEQMRAVRAGRPERPRFRFSLRTAFGRRPGLGIEDGSLTLLTGVPRRGR